MCHFFQNENVAANGNSEIAEHGCTTYITHHRFLDTFQTEVPSRALHFLQRLLPK